MLLPAIIFLMILFPVLLPAGITAVDAITRAYRTQPGASPVRRPSRRLTSGIPQSGPHLRVWPRLVYGAPDRRTAAPYQ